MYCPHCYISQMIDLEIYIRRSLAFLLLCCYKVKRYHPIFDFLIFLIAFILFKYSLFFIPAPLPELKGTILAADWTSKYDR